MDITHYYEFSDNDYYALIAVTTDKDDLYVKPYRKATEIYVEIVAGESIEEVLDEAHPNLRTQEYAFMKFIHGVHAEDLTVNQAIKQFEETKHGILLIDGSLI